MMENGFIKIEPEDIEYEEENISHNQQQQIKDEDNLLDIDIKFEVTELEAAEVKVEEEFETAEEVHINFNKNRYSENKTESKDERNCKNVPTSCRQSSNSACTKDSIVDSNNVNTKSCCNICYLYKQQKIVLNCKFCDLNYVGDTKSNLHDVRKIFHLIDDISQETAPQKSHVAKTQTNCDELFDYCGNILKLKYREFFIVCGSSEIEYAMDLFERHAPHHDNFEQSRIKSETSRDIVETIETDEDATKLPELIKQEKETVMDTIQPTPTNYNKIKQKDSRRTDLEADFLKALTQKTTNVLEESCVEDQSSRVQIKEECIIEQLIVLEESCLEDQSSRDQIKEEFIVEESCLQDQSYRDQIKEEFIVEESIVLEESCLQDQSYRDQIKEECIVEEQSLLEPFHQEQFQQSNKQFKCTLCRLSFLSEKDVSLHMRHCVERPFKCTKCFMGFTKKCSLKRHLQGHTAEKRFVCDICNTRFKTKSTLGDHKRIHMREAAKKYECEYCGKKFLRNGYRKNHLRTHTGEKPYECDICRRRFAKKYNLSDHFKRLHTLKKIKKT